MTTPATPDFRLYPSNTLELLAALLADELRRPVPGQALLAPDIVLIPQVAMRRWLQATLAAEYGIAANLDFLTPGEFVARALDANLGPAGGDDLDAASLQWRLYAALDEPAVRRDPALATLDGWLADGDPLKPWQLAGELAGVYEKYQAWRRDWLLRWEAGADRDDPQARLWRAVAAGRDYRARRIDAYLARFGRDDGPLPQGLPKRLLVFATLNISPDVLRVLATQARVGTLHFYLPTPAQGYWGDLQTLRERRREGEAELFADDVQENPLLQAWAPPAAISWRCSAITKWCTRAPRSTSTPIRSPATAPTRCCTGCNRTCSIAARPHRRRRAARPTWPIPACRYTPAIRACANCRCCTTSCAHCWKTRASIRRCSRATSPCSRRTSTLTCRIWMPCSAAAATTMRCRGRWRIPVRWRASRWSRCSCACSTCRCRASAWTRYWTCSPARPWPKRRASTPMPSTGCTAGCARPARAGAWMPATAPRPMRPPTMPTPGSSRSTACCSAMPAAPTTPSPASRPGRNWKAARSMRWIRSFACCATWRASAACSARRRRPRSGANACCS